VNKRSKPGAFATMLRSRMAELRWSQLDLAKAYGCDRQRIKMLLRQKNMTEAVFLKCCNLLGVEVELWRHSRPLPPLTATERRVALKAADAAERYGDAFGAKALRELLAEKPDGIGLDRESFDCAMRRVQKSIVQGKVRARGYDPKVVLDERWL